MRFSTREDIEVPIETVFKDITNFEVLERRALRRGAEVIRTDPPEGPGQGTVWEVTFAFRGRDRDCVAEVVGYDAPNTMIVDSNTGGLAGQVTLDLVALNPNKTRVKLVIDLKPNNLSARLLVQSLKLAKASLEKRLSSGFASFAQQMERDYRGTKPGETLG